jgi:hypothetical protein
VDAKRSAIAGINQDAECGQGAGINQDNDTGPDTDMWDISGYANILHFPCQYLGFFKGTSTIDHSGREAVPRLILRRTTAVKP